MNAPARLTHPKTNREIKFVHRTFPQKDYDKIVAFLSVSESVLGLTLATQIDNVTAKNERMAKDLVWLQSLMFGKKESDAILNSVSVNKYNIAFNYKLEDGSFTIIMGRDSVVKGDIHFWITSYGFAVESVKGSLGNQPIDLEALNN
jgi:hypothetical protein